MTIPKCPDCSAPLWLRACKCGWQQEPQPKKKAITYAPGQTWIVLK